MSTLLCLGFLGLAFWGLARLKRRTHMEMEVARLNREIERLMLQAQPERERCRAQLAQIPH